MIAIPTRSSATTASIFAVMGLELPVQIIPEPSCAIDLTDPDVIFAA
jgi:hypothetical protein